MQDAREQRIVRRVLRELQGKSRVVLGPGLPERLHPLLGPEVEVFLLKEASRFGRAEAVVLEAEEVSSRGDLVLPAGYPRPQGEAPLWIVAGFQRRGDGEPRVVQSCRRPVDLPGKARLVVTELGVIRISEVGFELEEVAPGVGADDVKMASAASLHVVDGLQLMEG